MRIWISLFKNKEAFKGSGSGKKRSMKKEENKKKKIGQVMDVLNEKKIRLMIKLAKTEEGNGKENLRISGYYRSDYIGLALFRNFLLSSIAYLIILGLIGSYYAEFLQKNLHEMNLFALGGWIVGGYLGMLGIYSLITYFIYAIRYAKAERMRMRYEKEWKKLERFYEQKEVHGTEK